jgi:HTH-type transcriptional regulator/antitoxin HigA
MTSNAISVRPIRTEEDHELAITRIEQLMSAQPGTLESDELDVLATLVVAYEKEHYPPRPPKPLAAIEFGMDQQGMTRKDLEPLIGSRSRVSEILNGKRPLTLNMIRRLSAALHISADLLIAPLETKGSSGTRARSRAATARPGKKSSLVARLESGKKRRNTQGGVTRARSKSANA